MGGVPVTVRHRGFEALLGVLGVPRPRFSVVLERGAGRGGSRDGWRLDVGGLLTIYHCDGRPPTVQRSILSREIRVDEVEFFAWLRRHGINAKDTAKPLVFGTGPEESVWMIADVYASDGGNRFFLRTGLDGQDVAMDRRVIKLQTLPPLHRAKD